VVAIVGASTLAGKELKQVLEDRNFPTTDIRLLEDNPLAGMLTEAGGEPTFIRALEEESFQHVDFAFFAGTQEFTARHWPLAHQTGATVVDLSGALVDVPAAIPWIPMLDAVLPPPRPPVGRLFSSPPSPTVIACTLAASLEPFSLQRLVIFFLQPVSERGQPGIDELESQTVKLLSFQPISQEIFDAQVAFNLLGRYGEASRPQLSELRASISRDVARYLAARLPVPAIQLVQAPVFYSYAFMAFAELAAPRLPAELERALAAAGAKLQGPEEPGPSNVSVAGESQVVLARIEPDANLPAGCWIWGAADNVRLAAVNAVAIAERLLAS
jgi:aspartate-semialdehyde dehydrogenase